MKMRGLEEQHELSPQLLLRDTRTLGMKIADFFKSPFNSSLLLFGIGISDFFFPALAEIVRK